VDREVKIGKEGMMHLRPGFYLYVGSALGPGGLKARLARHARDDKSYHWHIDYLAPHTHMVQIWYTVYARKIEHQVVDLIFSHLEVDIPLIGFGSSDCGCDAHLFYAPRRPSSKRVRQVIGRMGCETFNWKCVSDPQDA
jgi:Uri superfamily endonuclease